MNSEDFLSRLKSKLQQKITSDSRGIHTFQNRYKAHKENIKYQRVLNVKINGPVNSDPNNQPQIATVSSPSIVPTILHLPPPIVLVNETPEESILPIIKSESDNETEEKSIMIKDEPKSDNEEFPTVKKNINDKKVVKVRETQISDLKATLLKNLKKITMMSEIDSDSLKIDKNLTNGSKRKKMRLNATVKKRKAFHNLPESSD